MFKEPDCNKWDSKKATQPAVKQALARVNRPRLSVTRRPRKTGALVRGLFEIFAERINKSAKGSERTSEQGRK